MPQLSLCFADSLPNRIHNNLIMANSDTQLDKKLFVSTSPYFPLMCGLEFLNRPVRLSKESQQDFGLFAELGRLNNWQFDRQRIQLFLQNPAHALIVTDRSRSIQYVNRGFSRMTGYNSQEALNQFPAFLQGPDTDPDTKLAIRTALTADESFSGDILNYRKDGEPYWCRVAIEPIFSQQQITHYVAFEREVDKPANSIQFK